MMNDSENATTRTGRTGHAGGSQSDLNDEEITRTRLGQHGETARDEARETGTSARSKVADTAHDLKDRAQERAHEYSEQAKAFGEQALEKQRHRAADEVRHFGAAIRQAATKLEEEGDQAPARHATKLANGIDRVANYVDERPPRLIARDAGNVVREHPKIALGGLFAVGLLAGRFLRATEQPPEEEVILEGSTFVKYERPGFGTPPGPGLGAPPVAMTGAPRVTGPGARPGAHPDAHPGATANRQWDRP